MAPRELVFTGETDVDEFFFTYELVEMIGKTEDEKAKMLPAYLKGDAFKLYREMFTQGNSLNNEALDFEAVKDKLHERFSEKLTVAEATVKAVNLSYSNQKMDKFLKDSDKLYELAGFSDEAKFGLIRKAIDGDKELLKFVVLRSAKTYEDVKDACTEYADNPAVFLGSKNGNPTKHKGGSSSEDSGKKQHEDKMEELCRQMEEVKLFMANQKKTSVPDKPSLKDIICHRCKKPGHYAYQCQVASGGPVKCTYCGKHGHTANACYTKQRDEEARTRLQTQATPVTVLKRDDETKPGEGDKSVLVMTTTVEEEEVMAMPRDTSGLPPNKRVRVDVEGDEVLVDNNQANNQRPLRRRPTFTTPGWAPPPRRSKPSKTKGGKKPGSSKKKSVVQEMTKRVEQYDLVTSLAQASAGITFGQIARGDVDDVRKELQEVFSAKGKKKSVNAVGEHGNGFVPPNRHQVVRLTVHSEHVYALLDSGAIPNVMSLELARKLKLELRPSSRRIIVADGSTNACEGIVDSVPVGFGNIVKKLRFMVIKSVPFHLIIGAPTLVLMCTSIDLYHHTVKIWYSGQTETLSLEYEPEFGDDTEDDFTSDSTKEDDIGEESDPSEDEVLILMVGDGGENIQAASKDEAIDISCSMSVSSTGES